MQAVVTDKGRITADTVVVALGSFTAPMLAKNGIRVPIYPVKGVSITFKRAGWNAAPTIPVIDDSKLFGFVPIGGIGPALQMARGQRGPDARIGFLLAPPYFPLRVGSGEA